MCTCTSVFGRCVGRGIDHPRLGKPFQGGRESSFALAWFELISAQQQHEAAGVFSSHSSPAARLARRVVLSSRPATRTVGAGWAAQASGTGLLFFFPRGLGKKKDKSQLPQPLARSGSTNENLLRGFCSSSPRVRAGRFKVSLRRRIDR